MPFDELDPWNRPPAEPRPRTERFSILIRVTGKAKRLVPIARSRYYAFPRCTDLAIPLFQFARKVSMSNRLSWLAVPLILAGVIGCDSGPTYYPVSGKVSIKGTPAPEGTRVNFEPTAGGELAAGIVDGTGTYVLYSGNQGREGALPGSYKVYLAPSSDSDAYMTGPAGGPSGAPGIPSAGPIPKEYLQSSTSPLTVEVSEGENSIDVTVE